MVFVFTSLIFLFTILVILCIGLPQELNSFKKTKNLSWDVSELDGKLNILVKQKSPVVFEIFKGKIFIKLVLPGLIVFLISVFLINPKITSTNFAFVLAIVMSLTYSSRIYYHNLNSFRSNFLSQLKQLFLNVRNQLSTGISLDQALSQNLELNYKEPLKRELSSFVKIAQTNLIENFPIWLIRIQDTYKLSGIDRASQLLKLELKYNNNQEDAFERAIEAISQKVEQNTKQKNTVLITLTTIDFLTLMFFGVMFFVIPGLTVSESNWWLSFRREFTVFISALILWSLYFSSVIFLIRRVA